MQAGPDSCQERVSHLPPQTVIAGKILLDRSDQRSLHQPPIDRRAARSGRIALLGNQTSEIKLPVHLLLLKFADEQHGWQEFEKQPRALQIGLISHATYRAWGVVRKSTRLNSSH